MKLKLKHFALFAKGHYAWPKENTEHNEKMWDCVKSALCADDYQPQTKEDIINILISNIAQYGKKNKVDDAMDFVNAIHPQNCYKIGYFTTDFFLARGYVKRIKYDYMTAVLYYYISKVRFMQKKNFGKLPKPDARVLTVKTNKN